MSKQIAILEYSFMFDPSETWSNGSQFEAKLADFFSAYGFEAEVIESRGGTGRRVVYISRVEQIPLPNKPEREENIGSQQIKQVQQSIPTKSFKQFRNVHGVPIHAKIHKNTQTPDISFKQKITIPKK